jgi:hypothetical protein
MNKRVKRFWWPRFFWVGFLVFLLPAFGFSQSFQPFEVENRTNKIMSFPCSKCHNGNKIITKYNIKKPFHDIQIKHKVGNRNCYDCHSNHNYNMLTLRTGKEVSFNTSQNLCGQCHGIVKRDWDLGIHGKRLGGWMKNYRKMLCIECHNPHNPTFPKMQALPLLKGEDKFNSFINKEKK